MPLRFFATLRNYGRALVGLRHSLLGKKREIEQAVVAQPCVVRDPNQVNGSPSAWSSEPATPAHAEFLRTQSQLMETMLKTMILAAGWKVDGRLGGTDEEL